MVTLKVLYLPPITSSEFGGWGAKPLNYIIKSFRVYGGGKVVMGYSVRLFIHLVLLNNMEVKPLFTYSSSDP